MFAAKVGIHQLARALKNLRDPVQVAAKGDALATASVLAQVRSPLWTAEDPREWPLEAGKVENLRVAARALDGCELAAGAVFSFWAQVGYPGRHRGFVRGRELREGCIVPAIAGGICQLSNALYQVALAAGLEIRERHAHSRTVPGSAAVLGQDATVFWNYVDLRFRSQTALRIEVQLEADDLVVRLRGPVLVKHRLTLLRQPTGELTGELAGHDCHTCGETSCFRHDHVAATAVRRTAFLVDNVWPELDAYVQDRAMDGDLLHLPLDGRRFGRARYAWSTQRLQVHQYLVRAALRALHSRYLGEQGAARQRAILAEDDRLATAMAARLPPDVRHVVVTQTLLPALWRSGALGGRHFEVLMTRLPLAELQARLDAAAAVHRDSPTLADFRAEPWRVACEQAALAAADRVVTPHAEVAALFPGRCLHVPWRLPSVQPRRPGPAPQPSRPVVVFPASTVGRKGAWELREALRELGQPLTLWVLGRSLEGPDFWRGLDVVHGGTCPWWPDAMVLPAHVEHQPRALLAALAGKIPVVASTACGLGPRPGLVLVPAGDVQALRQALAEVLKVRVGPPTGRSGGPACR